MKRGLILLTILAIPHAQLVAQIDHTVKQITPAEPFKIEKGVSFSASVPVSKVETAPRPATITDDVAEAIAVIKRSYVGSKSSTPSLIHNAIDGMLQTLDPHSAYFDAAEYADLLDEENSEYYGIGATIANFKKEGKVETYVLATSPGSAAARAGLRFGDRIEKVNGEDVSELSSDIVRDKVRGPAGSQVAVIVERAGTGKLEKITLARGRVPYATVTDAYMVRPGVGYIDLTEGFNFTTSAEFSRALLDLRRKGLEGLVVDLRGNPGGVLDQAVKIAEKFLPAGEIIVTQKGRSRADNRVWRSTAASPEKMPVVLLVDQDSASASEVLAGALQDHDRALIVGESTFGKGLVQSVMDLPGGTGLTLTTARYYTPSGRSIQRDYSDGSLYAYFNERRPADTAKRQETVTDSKRKVYGGEGITPDHIVQEHRYSAQQSELLDPTFFFVRDLLNRPADRFVDVSASGDRLSVDVKKVSAEFRTFLATDRSWNIGPNTIASESTFLASRVAYYFALGRSGNVAARRVELGSDPGLMKAIELLPQAAELAKNTRRLQRASTNK